MNVPPWTYRVFEPNTKTATVRVRLFAAELPSHGRGDESIEALVEFRGRKIAMSRHYSETRS